MSDLPNDGKLTTDDLPCVTLKSGEIVQTGTAARLVITIQEYDHIDDADPEAEEKKTHLVEEMTNAVHPLHSVGLLGLFHL